MLRRIESIRRQHKLYVSMGKHEAQLDSLQQAVESLRALCADSANCAQLEPRAHVDEAIRFMEARMASVESKQDQVIAALSNQASTLLEIKVAIMAHAQPPSFQGASLVPERQDLGPIASSYPFYQKDLGPIASSDPFY